MKSAHQATAVHVKDQVLIALDQFQSNGKYVQWYMSYIIAMLSILSK